LKYIAISETISHYLKENGISEEKVKIIPNSVPVAIPISKSSRDCVFFGRIEEEKGIFELIEAWRIGRELPTLHVIGGGTKLNEVQILAKPLRNVIIHGAKYGSELDEILHKSKVAIFPGAWKEPFGRTLVESLARGHAIATTKNFSQHDLVIEGINGSIFNLDSLSIIESVQECLALDIVNQIKTSRNAWQKNFSPASVSRFWDQNYNDKLNNI
jgi:glycosyltransferase involved in cell wall biosynthesis